MKYLFTALFVSIAFIIAGCGSEQEEHSHGDGADHAHETPAHQPSEHDGEPVRIGSDHHSDEIESDHSHDENSDHQHSDTAEEDTTDQQNEAHPHNGDSAHSHDH